VTTTDVARMRELIAEHPGMSRRRLSVKVCESFGWRQTNGALRDMIVRGLMLALDRAGEIELPAVKQRPRNPLAQRAAPEPVEINRSEVVGDLPVLGTLEFRQVRRSSEERLFNGLMHQHHYLGFTRPVGENLKIMVYAGERPVALFAWSSAPRHLAPRDMYLGWSAEARRRNIRYVAYNTRYLILPWIQVKCLASHALSRMTRMLSTEWERLYGHGVYFAETFVDPTRHRGTTYIAANWMYLGRTTGRGKADNSKKPNRTLKNVLGLPLVEDFRERLAAA